MIYGYQAKITIKKVEIKGQKFIWASTAYSESGGGRHF